MILPTLADSRAAKDFLARSCPTVPGFYLDFTWTLRPVPFLSFTMIQSNTAHAFLDYYTETDSNIFQILHR